MLYVEFSSGRDQYKFWQVLADAQILSACLTVLPLPKLDPALESRFVSNPHIISAYQENEEEGL